MGFVTRPYGVKSLAATGRPCVFLSDKNQYGQALALTRDALYWGIGLWDGIAAAAHQIEQGQKPQLALMSAGEVYEVPYAGIIKILHITGESSVKIFTAQRTFRVSVGECGPLVMSEFEELLGIQVVKRPPTLFEASRIALLCAIPAALLMTILILKSYGEGNRGAGSAFAVWMFSMLVIVLAAGGYMAYKLKQAPQCLEIQRS